MKKLKHEAELFKAALLAGVQYAEGRGAVEFEATDSASDKALYVYRLLVHDKIIAPMPEDQVSEKTIRRKMQAPVEGDSASRQNCLPNSIAECAGDRYIVQVRWGVMPHAAIPTVLTHEGGVMVTKRVSPVKKTTRRKAAAELTDSAAMMVLESAPSEMTASTSIDPDTRRQLVAAEAYFRAERRGFAAGSELDDWVAAEMAVDMRLQQTQVA